MTTNHVQEITDQRLPDNEPSNDTIFDVSKSMGNLISSLNDQELDARASSNEIFDALLHGQDISSVYENLSPLVVTFLLKEIILYALSRKLSRKQIEDQMVPFLIHLENAGGSIDDCLFQETLSVFEEFQDLNARIIMESFCNIKHQGIVLDDILKVRL